MGIAQSVEHFSVFASWAWPADWAWGVPLIVVTVLVHVFGLVLVRQGALRMWRRTILHGLEAAIWAGAYRFIGALPDNRSAMLYSLEAMTSYGHTILRLEDRWLLLGAIEALNGWLLF